MRAKIPEPETHEQLEAILHLLNDAKQQEL